MNTYPAGRTARSTAHRPAIVAGMPAKSPAQKARRPIRVLMVDDHPVARKGMAYCLAQHEHLEIVGEAADGPEAAQKAKSLLPDLVITDFDMPQMNGLALTELLRQELPQVKVLVLSMHRNTDYIVRTIQAGA